MYEGKAALERTLRRRRDCVRSGSCEGEQWAAARAGRSGL